MKIATASSGHLDEKMAVRECFTRVQDRLNAPIHLLILYTSVEYDTEVLVQELRHLAPGVPIHGGTSSQGVMTEEGYCCEDVSRGMGIFALSDSEGAFGTGSAEIAAEPRVSAISAAREALIEAGRPGESPAMVWMMAAPGVEEEIIYGLSQFFGPNVPICGGSSADNDVSGKWSQFTHKIHSTCAVVITVFFPSSPISFAFQGGYDATETTAVITRGNGRVIQELDGKPAAEFYNSWTGGQLGKLLGTDASVIRETSLYPLGRIVGYSGKTPYFQLSHPESISSDGSLSLFSNIEQGEKIYLMKGSGDALVNRARRVVESAIRSSSIHEPKIVGALVIYCAGCMFTVKDRMSEVVGTLRSSLGEGTPFLGAFTFGEQGCFFGGENRHGNLMISLVLFFE